MLPYIFLGSVYNAIKLTVSFRSINVQLERKNTTTGPE